MNNVGDTVINSLVDLMKQFLPTADNSTTVMDLADRPTDILPRLSTTSFTKIDIVCPDDT
jgi:hypothetical protein